MKGKQFMIFFLIVFAVNLLVNLYIFSRTRGIFPTGNAAWWSFTILFWIIAFSYVIGRITESSGAMWLANPFVHIGSYWLGAMVYLTLLFLFVDILRGINGLFNFSEMIRFSWSDGKGKTAVLLVYALSAVILVAGYISATVPVVRKQTIQLNKPVPDGKQRVVLASDIHLGMMISNGRLERLVKLINAQNADVVLLAGDVFDEDLGPVIENNMGEVLKKLKSRHGVFAILGNHEFYGNANVAEKYLEDHNITVLRDSTAVLPDGTVIIGREDITGERMSGNPRKTINVLLSKADTQKPVYLLDHQPYKLTDAADHNIDLQVSGHTHNGQMWPFNYITGSLFEISRGYGKINDTHFYVSSGYGTWGPPIRTNSRSEIIVLDIKGN